MKILRRALLLDAAVHQHHDLVGDGQDALLMGNDQDGAVLDVFPKLLENARQVLEAPEVDARLRLVKQCEPCLPCHDRRDLDTLQLAAGQRRIDLAMDIVPGAEADLGQIVAGRVHGNRLARRKAQQVDDLQPLESDRLLERKGNAHARPFRDSFIGNVLAVEHDPARRRLLDAGDDPRQRRFPAAVRTGDHDEFPVLDGQADVLQDVDPLAVLLDGERDIFQFQHGMSPLVFV